MISENRRSYVLKMIQRKRLIRTIEHFSLLADLALYYNNFIILTHPLTPRGAGGLKICIHIGQGL